MQRKSTYIGVAILAGVVLLVSNCGGSKKPIVVGSKSTTKDVVLGEIIAQHLEHRLGHKVERNLSLGSTQVLYQSLANAQIGLYPEETGVAQASILKEAPSSDVASTFERVKGELKRLAQLEVLDPLGIDNFWTIVVRKDSGYSTISDAGQAKAGWKIGATREFNDARDGMPMLNQYHLPMVSMPRINDSGSIYAALAAGEINMVAGNATDGILTRHDEWQVLRDDKKVFPSYQTCIIVRTDVLNSDPKLQPALAELSGKFTNDVMSKLDAEVDVDHKKPGDVAKEFLAQTGLK